MFEKHCKLCSPSWAIKLAPWFETKHYYTPFKEERAYWFAHVGLLVCLSVRPSVTFFFPINNSRTPWPNFLKLVPHIVLGSRETILILGSLGQSSRSPRSNVPKPFPSITWECLDLPSSNLVHTSILDSRETLLFFGSLGQRSPGQICQNGLSNNFKNEFLLHTFVQLILNWLIQLYKTSVTKNTLGA